MPGTTKKRAYCPAIDLMAVRYAQDELGYQDPVIYGSQVDPGVRGVQAIWVRERADRTVRVGLIVCRENGVLDEFDPEDKPGTLRQKANPDLLDMTVEVSG